MIQRRPRNNNPHQQRRGNAEKLTLGLWNVRGIKTKEKKRVIKGFAQERKLHALICVETHASTEQHEELKAKWPGSAWGESDETKRDGVGIIPFHKDIKIQHLRTTTQGRVSDFHVEYKTLKLTVRVIYAPAREKERTSFMNLDLPKDLFEDEEVDLITGDFNCIESPDDNVGFTSTGLKGAKQLAEIMSIGAYRDALDLTSRQRGPAQNSFVSLARQECSRRLDRFYCAPRLQELIRDLTVKMPPPMTRLEHEGEQKGIETQESQPPSNATDLQQETGMTQSEEETHNRRARRYFDHHLVEMRLDVPGSEVPKRGPGLWRIDPTILRRTEIQEQVRKIIKKHEDSEEMPVPKLQEILNDIRDFLMLEDSKGKPKTMRVMAQQILQQEKESPGLLTPQRKEYWQQIYAEEANTSYEYKAAVRSANQANNVEKPSALVTRVIAARQKDRNTATVKNEQGKQVKEQEIAEVFARKFEKHFGIRETHQGAINTMLHGIDANQRAWTSFQDEMTPKEYRQVLKKVDKNTSPGWDGLGWSLLATFATELQEPALEAFNEIWSGQDDVPSEWLHGIIAPIYKGKGEKESADNWRPITLLPCILKLMTKIVAARLQVVLAQIIHSAQTGFIKGRSMLDAAIIIADVIAAIQENPEEYSKAILVKRDFKAAFDYYQHTALAQVLEKYGCPKIQRDVLMRIMSAGTAQVSINGWISNTFHVKAGVRQGEPCAAILFALGVEPLSHQIRNDPSIEGVWTAAKLEVKLSLAADDTMTVAKNAKSETKQAEWCKTHCQATGSELNNQKSACIMPHRRNNDDPPPYTLIGDEGDRYLGFQMGPKGIVSKIPTIVDGIIETLTKYGPKSWTMKAKVMLARAYLLPRLYWHTAISKMLKVDIDRLNNALTWFYWSLKGEPFEPTKKYRQKMRAERLEQESLRGGLSAPNIKEQVLAQHASLFTKVIKGELMWTARANEIMDEICENECKLPEGAWKKKFYVDIYNKIDDKQHHILREGYYAALKVAKELPTTLPAPTGHYSKIFINRKKDSEVILTDGQQEMVENHQVHWPTVWKRLKLSRAIPSAKDTTWRAFSKALPFAYSNPDTRDPCAACGETERTLHIFVECPVAAQVVAEINNLLEQHQIDAMTWSSKTWHELGDSDDVFRTTSYTITIRLIWLARNNILHSTDDVIDTLKEAEARAKQFHNLLAQSANAEFSKSKNNKNNKSIQDFQEKWKIGSILKFWHGQIVPLL